MTFPRLNEEYLVKILKTAAAAGSILIENSKYRIGDFRKRDKRFLNFTVGILSFSYGPATGGGGIRNRECKGGSV